MKARTITLGLAAGILLGAIALTGQGAGEEHRVRSLWQRAPAAERSRQNPYAGNPGAYLAGQKLFRSHCASCHAEDSRGSRWAPSLISERVRTAPPGALAWFLKNGDLRAGMPSWSKLPEERRWQIVTFLQASH
jgi:mono/diheme cytochrome c family protein